MRDDRSDCRTGNTEAADANQEYIQEYIDNGRQDQDIERRSGISDRAQGGGENIVKKGKNKTQRDNLQIQGCLRRYLFRRLRQADKQAASGQ